MKFVYIMLLILTLTAVNGCNSNGADTNQPQNGTLIEEHPFGLGIKGDGEFYRYKSLNDIGTYKTGAINVNLERVEVVRGSFNYDHSEVYSIAANETLDVINFHIEFELNRKTDDFTFNQEHIHLLTDNGEEIKQPNELLSSVMHASVLKFPKDKSERNLRQFSFRLKESTAEEIEKATLIIDPPVNKNGEHLGEKIEIEVDFSKNQSEQ